MKPEIKKYLFDIKESIDSIENYLGDKRNFRIYSENKMLRRAVERELEIIAEAILTGSTNLINQFRSQVRNKLLE